MKCYGDDGRIEYEGEDEDKDKEEVGDSMVTIVVHCGIDCNGRIAMGVTHGTMDTLFANPSTSTFIVPNPFFTLIRFDKGFSIRCRRIGVTMGFSFSNSLEEIVGFELVIMKPY